MEDIRIRNTEESDLEFVLSAEKDGENNPFVAQWSREQHMNAMKNEDIMHVIIELPDGKIVGYAIIAGLQSPNKSIELKRIVIVDKGKGLGRKALEAFKSIAFNKLNAHRLWLDVRANNDRARHLYKSVGFVEEGLIRECVLVNDRFVSIYMMSILEHEYKG